MRRISQLALAGVFVLGTAQPSSAAQGTLEAAWSDTVGSNTLVTESTCSTVSGPTPYNAKCTFRAEADSTLSATPKRGQCSEVLVTAGTRTLAGPCAATFEITMRVHRVKVDRQSPAVYSCNGTSANQTTDAAEPVELKGNFRYSNDDGINRLVEVDVTIVNNVLTFEGSIARVGTQNIVDEVNGRFPIRCRASTGNGYSGDFTYVI